MFKSLSTRSRAEKGNSESQIKTNTEPSYKSWGKTAVEEGNNKSSKTS